MKKVPKPQLYYRVRLPDGSYPYLKPASTTTGRIRPDYALIGGKPAHLPDGTYYLRLVVNGKRVWEPGRL